MIRVVNWATISLFVLLLNPFFYDRFAHAQPTYNEVSKSINNAFNSSHVLLSTLITLVFFMFLIFVFRLSMIKKEKDWARTAHVSAKLHPLNPQQKRNWYRLKTDLRLKWIPMTTDPRVKEKNSFKNYRTDFMVDLSGGGLCFVTAENIKSGDLIRIHLDLDGHPLLTQGTVMRVENFSVDDGEMRKVSVEFNGLLAKEREQIVSFIMKCQRNAIQTEKMKDSTSAPIPEIENGDIEIG